MKRREFVAAVGALLAASPVAGQQPGRVYKIGYISPNIMPRSVSPLVRDAFNKTLAQLGFVVGENIVEEGRGRGAEGRPERLEGIATELVGVNVDVIVAIGTGAVQAARHATRTIPIVMAYVHDPIADGLIASLARPGGNVTGLATLGTDLGAKVMQLIKELLPRASRIVVIMNRDSATSRRIVSNVQQTAKPLGLTLLPIEVGDVYDFEKLFDAIKSRRPDAIWVISTIIGRDPRPIELLMQHRLPSIYGARRAVERGRCSASANTMRCCGAA